MCRICLAALCLVLTVWSGELALAQPSPGSPAEAQAWARYLVPLPKSLSITYRVEVDPASIAIAGPGGSEADSLIPLKNSDQASKITIEPGNNGLRLIALQPRGLYYAVKSLQQLIAPYVTATNARLPLLEVVDWPDMADRGLWGCDHYDWLRWMADRKLNIGEQISARSVTSDGVGHSSLKPGREPMVTEGPYYGLAPVPVTLHLEQVWRSGLFDYYPQLIGVGGQYGCRCDDDSGHYGVRVLCADAAWPKPAAGSYVRVDGMSSAYLERGRTWRALYVSDPANIVIVRVPLEIVLDEDATARWTPNIPQAGNYDVYVMYCEGADRTVEAPYTISFSGGSQTYRLNQTTGGGVWQLLGRQPFAPGSAGYVQLGNATTDAGTTLSVSPTVTTTYYPRWEAGSGCPSDDGAAVTITVI